MTHVHQGRNFHLWSRTDKLTLSSPEHAPAYMMAANGGVIKAIVSFYRVNSGTAFERHRSRVPINDLNTVHALKRHLIQFLGLKELTIKYGLGDFDIKLYRMAPKPGGESDIKPINWQLTNGQNFNWQLTFVPPHPDPQTILPVLKCSELVVHLCNVWKTGRTYKINCWSPHAVQVFIITS